MALYCVLGAACREGLMTFPAGTPEDADQLGVMDGLN